jgi:hypothetical protein
MYNKRLEYNPLFESLTETAKRYSRINEEGATGGTGGTGDFLKPGTSAYKTKYAIEYAKKIFQLIYDEYFYFLSSIKDETIKNKFKSELFDFIKLNSQKSDINLDVIAKDIITRWQTMNSSTEVKNIAASSDDFRKAYESIDKGVVKLSQLLSAYSQKYGTEATNPSLITEVKTLINNALTNLEQAKQDTKKV